MESRLLNPLPRRDFGLVSLDMSDSIPLQMPEMFHVEQLLQLSVTTR
jgi:hypothetical protein